ncbi:ABC transporter ATP-binding protein [Nonlabens sp. SY33080]|uniref:ABC transporter ATP-binding protein n=1 Tax=Nonlabens sp. SY33080 TaxID=2719911 RepID=UPI00142895BA|nr:ABC transporter ATP-binding protein [Nonlabens sp. SY33080]
MEKEVLVKVEGLSKKFCKSLKKSLKYGMQDLAANLLGKPTSDELRPDEFWALKDINFELRRGECLGLIGHNGAGKSTLLKILNGLINPDHGKVTMRGRVGALIELGAGFNPILSGRENIYNNGAILGFSRAEIDDKVEEIIDFAEIREFIDMPVQNYSSGMRVRLGFAVAAQMEPDVLIIDEVLAVGDLGFRMKCYDYLINKLSKNVALILVSHNMVDVMRLCEIGVVLNKGRMDFIGERNTAVGLYNTLGKTKVESKGDCMTVGFLNQSKGIQTFSTGDDVVFEIVIHSKNKIKNARIMSHLEFSNVRLSSISSKYLDFVVSLEEGMNTFHLKYKNIPLLIGGYLANFEVYGEQLKDFIASADTISFQITAPDVDYFGNGRCHVFAFDHEWSKIN